MSLVHCSAHITTQSSVLSQLSFSQHVNGGNTSVALSLSGLTLGKSYNVSVFSFGDIRSEATCGPIFTPYINAPGVVISSAFSLNTSPSQQYTKTNVADVITFTADSTDAIILIEDKQLSLVGTTSIIGRSIVVKEDGLFLGAGVVGISKPQ